MFIGSTIVADFWYVTRFFHNLLSQYPLQISENFKGRNLTSERNGLIYINPVLFSEGIEMGYSSEKG